MQIAQLDALTYVAPKIWRTTARRISLCLACKQGLVGAALDRHTCRFTSGQKSAGYVKLYQRNASTTSATVMRMSYRALMETEHTALLSGG
jgi:hypothetical protein